MNFCSQKASSWFCMTFTSFSLHQGPHYKWKERLIYPYFKGVGLKNPQIFPKTKHTNHPHSSNGPWYSLFLKKFQKNENVLVFCPFLKSSLPTLIKKNSSSTKCTQWNSNVQNMIFQAFIKRHVEQSVCWEECDGLKSFKNHIFHLKSKVQRPSSYLGNFFLETQF